MELTKEYVLEQLFDYGNVEYIVELIPNKLYVTIRTLTPDDYKKLDNKMMSLEGDKVTKLQYWQQYILERLSMALLRYKDKEFKTSEEAKEFLNTLSSIVVDKLYQELIQLEKKVKEFIGYEEVDKNFFQGGVSQIKPEQSQKE